MPLLVLMAATLFQLPMPTGSWPVGTASYRITDNERGSNPDGTDAPRMISIHAWYPAASGAGPRAPYLRDLVAAAELRKLNPGVAARLLLEGVITHATFDAPIARVSGGIPVLLFSHGYLALPEDYTALMEDLASHGYAVFSITHPYETAATGIGDGRVALAFGARGLNDITRAVIAEWSDEDSVSARVTAAPDRATAERITREFLGRIPKSTESLERWVLDMQFVSNHVGRFFEGALDVSRLGAFGHSMGGITSATFCGRDKRCKAALNLDGSPQYGDLIDHPSKRPFLMVYASRAGRIGVSDVVYGKGTEAWRAVIDGALHLNFGDFQYRQGEQRLGDALGTISAERSTVIVHRLVREWFDKWLGGKESPLLDGERVFPEVEVSRIGRP